jgi:hypothetical protein
MTILQRQRQRPAAAAAVAKAKAAAEAEAEAEAEVEELDTSLPSFSTSAALSFDDDFIAPDISAGKAPVNCVKGGWTNDGGCDQNTGVQIQKRQITPAKYGGTCEVSADKIDDEGFQRQNVNCRVDCKGGYDENWSGCTVAGQSVVDGLVQNINISRKIRHKPQLGIKG